MSASCENKEDAVPTLLRCYIKQNIIKEDSSFPLPPLESSVSEDVSSAPKTVDKKDPSPQPSSTASVTASNVADETISTSLPVLTNNENDLNDANAPVFRTHATGSLTNVRNALMGYLESIHLDKEAHFPVTIYPSGVARNKGIPKRRVYDVIHVLEAVGLFEKTKKVDYWGVHAARAELMRITQASRTVPDLGAWMRKWDDTVGKAKKFAMLTILARKLLMILCSVDHHMAFDEIVRLIHIGTNQSTRKGLSAVGIARRLYDVITVMVSSNILVREMGRPQKKSNIGFNVGILNKPMDIITITPVFSGTATPHVPPYKRKTKKKVQVLVPVPAPEKRLLTAVASKTSPLTVSFSLKTPTAFKKSTPKSRTNKKAKDAAKSATSVDGSTGGSNNGARNGLQTPSPLMNLDFLAEAASSMERRIQTAAATRAFEPPAETGFHKALEKVGAANLKRQCPPATDQLQFCPQAENTPSEVEKDARPVKKFKRPNIFVRKMVEKKRKTQPDPEVNGDSDKLAFANMLANISEVDPVPVESVSVFPNPNPSTGGPAISPNAKIWGSMCGSSTAGTPSSISNLATPSVDTSAKAVETVAPKLPEIATECELDGTNDTKFSPRQAFFA